MDSIQLHQSAAQPYAATLKWTTILWTLFYSALNPQVWKHKSTTYRQSAIYRS